MGETGLGAFFASHKINGAGGHHLHQDRIQDLAESHVAYKDLKSAFYFNTIGEILVGKEKLK